MKKNILVVFTGGTIGSTVSNGVINTSQQQRFKLIQLFQSLPQSEEIYFDCIQPLQLLSENLQPSIWTTLVEAIERQNPNQYDGIIVTHGTDTLAFTAAALSFYFHNLAKPLLLVSSNYPLEHPQANGLQNFCCAVAFIVKQIQNGVFVPYTNSGQITQLHIGSRLASCLQLSGDFISVQSNSYMMFENAEFHYLTQAIKPSPAPFAKLTADFSKQILLIKPYPGLDYSHFNLTGMDAILHDLYHSGTACTVNDEGNPYNNLSGFIQRCRSANISCYFAPALKAKNNYAGQPLLIQSGTVLWNMSLEAAYVKLLLAYSNFVEPKKIAEFMNADIALEHVANNG